MTAISISPSYLRDEEESRRIRSTFRFLVYIIVALLFRGMDEFLPGWVGLEKVQLLVFAILRFSSLFLFFSLVDTRAPLFISRVFSLVGLSFECRRMYMSCVSRGGICMYA